MGRRGRPQTPGDLRTPVKEYSNLWGVASEGGTKSCWKSSSYLSKF